MAQIIWAQLQFLLDPSGVVRWVNLTEDFRVRATPEEMLKGAKALRSGSATKIVNRANHLIPFKF